MSGRSASSVSIDLSFGSLDELVGDGEEEVVDGVGSARGALTDTERMAGINHMLLSVSFLIIIVMF